jgi:exportin-T
MSRDTGGLGFGDGVGLADGADGLDGLRAAGGVAARVVCVNPDTARSALRAIAEACVFRGAFPDERRAGVDFRDGGDPRVREAETETAELRRDLFVVFRSVARVSPAIALGAVREALAAALPADSSAPAPPWQRVEAAVAAVHLLGEGANDPAVKPGADGTAALVNAPSPLGELFAFVVSRWNGVSISGTTLAEATLRPNANPAATHRLVAPVFLETCARYHLAVARNPSALLLPALAAFLDARGARHVDPEVAARACYLLARFVKPLRQQIAAFLPETLAAMEEVVASAVEPPFQNSDASRTSGAAAVGRGTGGAMANSGNDDRLYAYEALGFLLGTEDVKLPEEAQVSLTEKACARLRARLEAATNGGDAETCARCIVACANVAKGFSSRLATEIRPRLGLALVAGLAPATACLARFDAASDPNPNPGSAAGVLRQRVVAYFQRMVQCVGRLAFPYAAPLVDRVRASGSASDLKECFVLCNQLCATFKSELAPFAETVTETLLAQTARALAPFASPDGHTHGVLGIFARVTDVPDALARADAAVAARAMARAGAAADADAADAAARNTEESREARELEATLVAHLHALGANGLWGAFEAPSSSVRETALATLAAWAAAHPSAVSRKAALQALHKIAQAWFPDDSRAGGVGERVPGFCQFASDVIVRECCVVAVLRGDLDVRDAAGAAAVGEAVAFQRFALERLGPAFAAQLRDGLLVAQLGLDPSLAAEYVAAVTSTAQTAHRDARAVVARCQKVVQGARPGMRRRPCKR